MAFSAPSFALFTQLLTGWVCAPGRRTITAMIAVADPAGRLHPTPTTRSSATGLGACPGSGRRWPCTRSPGSPPPEWSPWTVTTPCSTRPGAGSTAPGPSGTRCGPHGAASSTRSGSTWSWSRCGSPRRGAVPDRGAGQRPAAPQERHHDHCGARGRDDPRARRPATRAAAAPVRGRRLRLPRRRRPARTYLTSRMRRDAALYQAAPAPTGRPGRPRTKGDWLPTPTALAAQTYKSNWRKSPSSLRSIQARRRYRRCGTSCRILRST